MRRRLAGVLAVATLLAGCVGGGPSVAVPEESNALAPTATSTGTVAPLTVTHPTVWLCRPGLPANPCDRDLDATVVRPGGGTSTERFTPATDPPVDCFYVYPTVSPAKSRNAPLRATAAEIAAVRAQAARFGAVCRVFAPVYRQITSAGLLSGGLVDPKARALAHGDVVSAWHDYLKTYGAGRRFVLIGHSQGTFELTQLVREEIDPDPALRKRLVSALLIGGYVHVDPGKDTGDLVNVPACRTPGQTGCVVAYNSYPGPPPNGSIFGRDSGTRQILCTNPAALGGGAATLHPYVPAADRRSFTAYPDVVRAECKRGHSATWLEVRLPGTIPDAADLAGLGPSWGLHRGDVNLALGDLVTLVRRQSQSR